MGEEEAMVCTTQDTQRRRLEKEKHGKTVDKETQKPITSGTDQEGSVSWHRCFVHFTNNLVQPGETTQVNAHDVSCNASSSQKGGQTIEVTRPPYQNPCMMNKPPEISSGQRIDPLSFSMENSSSQMQDSESSKEPTNDYLNSQARKSIGKLIFEAGLEPGILHLPSFKDMVDVLAWAQVAIPTYESIMEEQLREIQCHARDLKKHWEMNGCSVILDTWESRCGKSFISVLVHCSKGMLFIKSMDVSDIIDDVDELAVMLFRVVEEVGVLNIVQVITNDESPYMQAAEHAVLKRYGYSFFFTLCADHCINLLLENIAALDHVNEVLIKAREITRFIYSHAVPMELKGKYIQGGEILSSSNLKFVAMFITLGKLVSERINLVEMFSSPEWASSDLASRSSFRHVYEVVKTDNAFWSAAADILKLTDPLITVLYKLEADNCPIGILYDAMDCAKEDIKCNLRDKHGDYWPMVDEIWDHYLHTPVHAAGYILNPRIFYTERFSYDTEIKSGTNACVTRLAKNHYDPKKVAIQMDRYRRKSAPFDSDSAIQQTMEIPQVRWWSAHGTDTPELQTFAIRILSQTCFGASIYNIDRSISEQLHVVKRTYPEQERFRTMEYLHYNLRLAHCEPCVRGASGAQQHSRLTSQLGDWISSGQTTSYYK
ncbi:uncharacterized protein [Oryza sativa Japonica Group]|uniref:Os06g0704000 protein n=2 Tax=Oryza sativa subsp. japonica TaxID=39947 RepID=Q5Z810_ORYSJ|nr:hypothetical protein OsJ_22556 [Oryza sativa Japonica Group]KAB8103763.1 hypothetical protein EE612_036359 [Oryza sativa]BAD54046.1 hAT dimerisation domain-containing protein-like [Oryza sativa Japonica Group]BAF20418.1 Os06g0704000 [Oryza sativa Japonica Group]BAG93528.1 unnamed protein product [Oryza sativa Japonica Group]|eukprot:NP_001058504.1 Os06g0704000 [Oryza sativa Japonica Group]